MSIIAFQILSLIINIIWFVFILRDESWYKNWIDIICISSIEIFLTFISIISISAFNKFLVPCLFIFQWFCRIINGYILAHNLKPYYIDNQLFKSKHLIVVSILNIIQTLILFISYQISYQIDFGYSTYKGSYFIYFIRGR